MKNRRVARRCANRTKTIVTPRIEEQRKPHPADDGMHNVILQQRRAASIALVSLAACIAPTRDAQTVVYASGADLESANPLVTLHPLSRQIQRFALFVTLARYDSLLQAQPYFARAWQWSSDRREVTFVLHPDLSWHDGTRTTARDVAFTLDAARNPATGYYRTADLAPIISVTTPNDTSVVVRFATPQPELPPIFCELPIAPAHVLSTVRSQRSERIPSLQPLGNGPFVFVRRTPGSAGSSRHPTFLPRSGAPHAALIVVAVVDEPTKFAGLVAATCTWLVSRRAWPHSPRRSQLVVLTIRCLCYRPWLQHDATAVCTMRAAASDFGGHDASVSSTSRFLVWAPSGRPVSPDNPRALALPSSPAIRFPDG